MKCFNYLTLLVGMLLGHSTTSYQQEVLPEVTVVAVNYKYLHAANKKEAAIPVKILQMTAAAYDVKSADFYEDEYDAYSVSFFIPEGKILASYDKEGKLLRTAERYKKIALPDEVRSAVSEKFPNWAIAKDIYLVNYVENSAFKSMYKLLLKNGTMRLRVKVSDKGTIL